MIAWTYPLRYFAGWPYEAAIDTTLIGNNPLRHWLDYKVFELKQKLHEIARTLVHVEKELYGEIWGLNGTK
jgi:hypothetical protein